MKLKIDFEKIAEDPLHWVRLGLYVAIFLAVAFPIESAVVTFASRAEARGWH